ncbi:fungal zn(2)-Cys(6) binuclear cluster domain-containing protein [Fusarium napiforme]|uniref:Fungal zn(2)-Cys(6) binuclear cluster domain-containing protein n=1 Tax=Fusarium napiforme TaxID=42672 RepID=A0A8H5JGK9_9HYPO|nr:fungal zn(2)-Cys(6) binuclear cluster domain-containing protein [Fusarium napiforme]
MRALPAAKGPVSSRLHLPEAITRPASAKMLQMRKGRHSISENNIGLPSLEKQTGGSLEDDWLDYDNFNWHQTSTMTQADLDLESAPQNINPDLKMSDDFMAGMDTHLDEGQWWNETTPIQTPLSNADVSDDRATPSFLQELTSQAMAVSTKTISATMALYHPRSAPPTVSSQYVNQAFDGTRTLVRIINTISMIISGENDENTLEGESCCGIGGLALTTLACQQHLLGLFKAIYKSIEHCIDEKSREKTAFGIDDSSSLIGDPAPSSAQFTMVLQLLVHLINRLDRCLFTGVQSTPSPNKHQGGMNVTHFEKNADELGSDRTSIAGLAQGSITGLSLEYHRLRQIISQLQGQMDTLEEI